MAITEKKCDTWESFVAELETLKKRQTRDGKPPEFLYRGQSDCSWTLETTLERYIKDKNKQHLLIAIKYFEKTFGIKPSLETMLNKKWEINHEKYIKFLNLNNNHPDRSSSQLIPNSEHGSKIYSYFIYLRHHGFPSPLLDWTRSPYIAAYFAFLDAKPDKSDTFVSIYTYQKPELFERWEKVSLEPLGPYVTTHPRHYHQQSGYTTCIENENQQLQFASHQKYFERNQKQQNLLWKFNIPASERTKVLAYLDQHNINDFTLFGSPESLMKTVAYREIDLRSDDS